MQKHAVNTTHRRACVLQLTQVATPGRAPSRPPLALVAPGVALHAIEQAAGPLPGEPMHSISEINAALRQLARAFVGVVDDDEHETQVVLLQMIVAGEVEVSIVNGEFAYRLTADARAAGLA